MSDATDQGDPAGDAATWVVDLELGSSLALVDGTQLDRAAFLEWLWQRFGDEGLAGIHEGDVDTAAAAAAGLVAPGPVLDAAVAPADRDWVGELAVTSASAWFTDEPAARVAADELTGLAGCTVLAVRREVAATDWRTAFTSIEVPGFGIVRPAWEPGEAGVAGDRATIFIEPGVGFGTGLHDTTQLCLAAIAAHGCEAGGIERMLDFGSGSGILAIAAAVGGAREVDAVEIDGQVHEAIRGNARRNRVADRLRVSATLADCRPPYDLVCANIVAEVLKAHADTLTALVVRPGGGLVLSGLLAGEAVAVADRYAALLGAQPRITQAGDWQCLRFTAAG